MSLGGALSASGRWRCPSRRRRENEGGGVRAVPSLDSYAHVLVMLISVAGITIVVIDRYDIVVSTPPLSCYCTISCCLGLPLPLVYLCCRDMSVPVFAGQNTSPLMLRHVLDAM